VFSILLILGNEKNFELSKYENVYPVEHAYILISLASLFVVKKVSV
jgi:hypothetical protein